MFGSRLRVGGVLNRGSSFVNAVNATCVRNTSHNANHNGQHVLFGGLPAKAFAMMVEKGAPFISHSFKPKIVALEVGKFSMILPFHEKLVGNTLTSCLHGGVVATMMDHVAGFCAWSSLPDAYHRVSTVQLTVEYLAPPPLEDLYFDATIEHQTNRLIRPVCVCWDSKRKTQIAIARGIFNVYKGKDNLAELIATAAKYQKEREHAAHAAHAAAAASASGEPGAATN